MDFLPKEHSPAKLPKMAIAAVAIGFFVGALSLAAATRHLAYVLAAVLPFSAALTVLRRRAWGGYGFALFVTAQSLFTPTIMLEGGNVPVALIAAIAVGQLISALLFFLAGRALSRTGAVSGKRWPWVALTAAFTLPLLFVRAYRMPSGSMEDTLLIGDRILVRVFPPPVPARGDLLVFHYPVDPKQVFVKRVIGLPGDHVRMAKRIVYVNGRALNEPYVVRRLPDDPFRDNLPVQADNKALEGMPGLQQALTEMLNGHVVNGEVVVPPRRYFVLGDNRDNSLDSRYWGFVDVSDVIGEPFLIYESEAGGDDFQVGAGKRGVTKARWDRFFKIL